MAPIDRPAVRAGKMIADENKGHKKIVFAAIYARTSSPNQRFNYSIKEQVDRCWKFCDERGWLAKYVFVDEGESGGTTDRPKFQLMLEKAKAGKFNVILFWKLDRFCRSLVDLVNIERMLRECEVGLCSVTEYLDTTTSVGRFNFRNLASVAELEREMIGERARIGLHALAKQHKWPNPHPPIGYDKREDGMLKVNGEADLVRRIFSMYLCEKSMPQVAYELNKQGILTKKGRPWNARAVRDVLINEIYIGKYRIASVEDQVEEYRIIEDGPFEQAKGIMCRFEDGYGAKRPPMHEDRRKAKIDKVFNAYFEFLKMRVGTSEDTF